MTNTLRTVLVLLPTVLASVAPAAAEPATNRLPTGWEWVIEPMPFREGIERGRHASGNGDVQVVWSFSPESLLLTAVITAPRELGLTESHATMHRAFVLTSDGELLAAKQRSMDGTTTLVRRTLSIRLEPDAVDPAACFLGVARLTLDGRIEASLEALDEARAVGAKALPLPIVGRPYEFDLPTIAGGMVRSDDLRGKVVVVDCWATWCMPCMEKMPALKSLAEKHLDDLVVIGVNFDDNLDDAMAEIAKGTVPGVQVHAASLAKGSEDLWERATGIRTIPRIFIIDREGVLVDDVAPSAMVQRVEESLAGRLE